MILLTHTALSARAREREREGGGGGDGLHGQVLPLPAPAVTVAGVLQFVQPRLASNQLLTSLHIVTCHWPRSRPLVLPRNYIYIYIYIYIYLHSLF